MAWVYLVLAGLFEIAMSLSLKASKSFTQPVASVSFFITAVISFYLLSLALRTLPVGTAYAVWTGIGAAGTAIVGIVALQEGASIGRIVSIVLIITGVIGLRLASGEPTAEPAQTVQIQEDVRL